MSGTRSEGIDGNGRQFRIGRKSEKRSELSKGSDLCITLVSRAESERSVVGVSWLVREWR